uniref:Zinc finger homeobox 4 n=1 Tax=Nothobranchius kadleci TaxID=1051664 RepID=A0A1A8E9X6_NOTKA
MLLADERFRKNIQGSPQIAPPTKQPPLPPRSSEPFSNGGSSSESSAMHRPMEPQVQWSHLAALKSSNSAAPSPPPPVVSRSQSFSESGGVNSSFAQLHLRSQDPHHLHHPSPARPDPQPQPPLHQAQSRLERQVSSEEVPPKVPVRTTSRSPVLSRRESPLPSQPSNQRNAGSNVDQRPLWDRVEKLQSRPGSGSSSGSNSSSQASPADRFRPRSSSKSEGVSFQRPESVPKKPEEKNACRPPRPAGDADLTALAKELRAVDDVRPPHKVMDYSSSSEESGTTDEEDEEEVDQEAGEESTSGAEDSRAGRLSNGESDSAKTMLVEDSESEQAITPSKDGTLPCFPPPPPPPPVPSTPLATVNHTEQHGKNSERDSIKKPGDKQPQTKLTRGVQTGGYFPPLCGMESLFPYGPAAVPQAAMAAGLSPTALLQQYQQYHQSLQDSLQKQQQQQQKQQEQQQRQLELKQQQRPTPLKTSQSIQSTTTNSFKPKEAKEAKDDNNQGSSTESTKEEPKTETKSTMDFPDAFIVPSIKHEFICRKCQMIFADEDSVVRHQKSFCYFGHPFTDPQETVLRKAVSNYSCVACNVVVNGNEALGQHLQSSLHKEKTIKQAMRNAKEHTRLLPHSVCSPTPNTTSTSQSAASSNNTFPHLSRLSMKSWPNVLFQATTARKAASSSPSVSPPPPLSSPSTVTSTSCSTSGVPTSLPTESCSDESDNELSQKLDDLDNALEVKAKTASGLDASFNSIRMDMFSV